jgi:hypothetical protein
MPTGDLLEATGGPTRAASCGHYVIAAVGDRPDYGSPRLALTRTGSVAEDAHVGVRGRLMLEAADVLAQRSVSEGQQLDLVGVGGDGVLHLAQLCGVLLAEGAFGVAKLLDFGAEFVEFGTDRLGGGEDRLDGLSSG